MASATQSTKRKGLFAKVETRDDALKTVREASLGFFILAGLQVVLGVLIAPSVLVDALVLAVLASILRKWNSRIAALLLLLVAAGEAVVTVLNRLGLMAAGGQNIFLAIIMLIVAARAVEATFKIHGRFASQTRGGA